MKSVDQVGRESELLSSEPIKRGYLARELVQCTLPHSNPKGLTEYSRKDGNLKITIAARSDIGLPYGTIPRLLMLWITSEAMRTGERKLILGNTLSQFLRDVGLDPSTGRGKRGDAKRLRDQMVRLFRSKISFDYAPTPNSKNIDGWLDMNVAPKGNLWWDFNSPDEGLLFDSWIELDETFFQAITANAVPVNLTMAGKLKKSPLALDLFVWATYRLYRMREGERITISLTDLQKQFGTDYKRTRDFRNYLEAAIIKIKGDPENSVVAVWKKAPIELSARGLVLTGIAHRELPVQPESKHRVLANRDVTNPFSISSNDLMKVSEHAQGWDVRALRREWEGWCKREGITPDNPLAHFIAFLKKHKATNG